LWINDDQRLNRAGGAIQSAPNRFFQHPQRNSEIVTIVALSGSISQRAGFENVSIASSSGDARERVGEISESF